VIVDKRVEDHPDQAASRWFKHFLAQTYRGRKWCQAMTAEFGRISLDSADPLLVVGEAVRDTRDPVADEFLAKVDQQPQPAIRQPEVSEKLFAVHSRKSFD
jgi:hypothetical protein